jgi:hypothetical protein
MVKEKLLLVYKNGTIEVLDILLEYCFVEKTYN